MAGLIALIVALGGFMFLPDPPKESEKPCNDIQKDTAVEEKIQFFKPSHIEIWRSNFSESRRLDTLTEQSANSNCVLDKKLRRNPSPQTQISSKSKDAASE